MPQERVKVVTAFGERGSVDKADLAEFLAQKGRVATADDLAEETHGGLGGMAKAAVLGAAETATAGGSTALLAQGGVALGGQEGRRSVEDEIRAIERTNPIAHTLGQVAPLALAPEAGGEELAASLIKGAGPAARAARFAAPHFARGVAETAAIEGSAGISEDLLDHNLAAESYYVHAFKPEVLYGGLLNVGVATGFKSIGKLTGAMGKSAGGRVGEVAANDAIAFEDVVRSVQKAGGTSDEATEAIRQVQRMTAERAGMPAERRAAFDLVARPYIERHAAGDVNTRRQLMRLYNEGERAAENLDKEIVAHARAFDTHATNMVNDLSVIERARSGLKQEHIQRFADPTRVQAAADAANGWLNELQATLFPHVEPPAPPPLASFEKQILSEWKKAGSKLPTDPAAAETYLARAKTFAEAAHVSATAEHAAEVERLVAERVRKIDPEVIRIAGYDPASAVGMARQDISKLESLVKANRAEIRKALDAGGAEAHARIFTAVDDTRRIVGQMASFGREGAYSGSVAKRLEQYFYNSRLKPLLEDSNVWGSKLAELQAENNRAFSETFGATRRFQEAFTGSFEHDEGARVFSSKDSAKPFIENLGDYGNGDKERIVEMTLDAARARGAAMLRTMDLPPHVQAAIKRAGESATEIEKILAAAKVTASDAREIRLMKSREAAAGGHGIIGKLLGFATSPARLLQMLGHFKHAETSVRKMLSGESKGFIKGAKVANVSTVLGEAERKAAIESIRDVQRYQADPRSLASAIKDTMGDMADSSPQMASAVAMTIARGVLALARRAPQPLPMRFSDSPGEERYANGALESYWRSKKLVERPPVIMQLMRSGQLHQEDMDLAKEIIPRLMTEMQMQLERDILDAKRKGGLRRMSYQEQICLSWMLGRPLDESQTPEFTAVMQQSAATDPMNQAAIGRSAQGGGRPSKLEKINLERYSTLEEKLEE